jgi:hypothetical protein
MPANFVQSGFSLIRPDANMLAGIFSFWRSHGITFVTIQSLQTPSITIALGFGPGSISIFYHGLIHFRRGSPDFNQG